MDFAQLLRVSLLASGGPQQNLQSFFTSSNAEVSTHALNCTLLFFMPYSL